MKNRETIFVVVAALVVGLLVGLLVSKGGRKPDPATSGAPVGAPAVNFQQNVAMLEKVLASDPTNRNAWVELGNTYFDSNQPLKAVDAYGRALELDPNDANVLTDQGVMFRSLGFFDQAAENFRQANKIDPTHYTSLYNLGVVYRYDMQDFPKAIDAWSRYLEVAPPGPGAAKVRGELEFMNSHPQMPKNN